jgi:hypothetical protein
MKNQFANSKSWGVGLGFAGFHAALILIFLAIEGFAFGGEARLLWILWIPIDFPISMLVGLGFDYIPESNEIFRTVRTWWPLIVHGIFGTVWWFAAPFTVVRVLESRKHRAK